MKNWNEGNQILRGILIALVIIMGIILITLLAQKIVQKYNTSQTIDNQIENGTHIENSKEEKENYTVSGEGVNVDASQFIVKPEQVLDKEIKPIEGYEFNEDQLEISNIELNANDEHVNVKGKIKNLSNKEKRDIYLILSFYGEEKNLLKKSYMTIPIISASTEKEFETNLFKDDESIVNVKIEIDKRNVGGEVSD